ncbi:unnamed protein product, partial [Owenia fusiformis]
LTLVYFIFIHTKIMFTFYIFFTLCAYVLAGPRVPESEWTDLDRYVFTNDPEYSYFKQTEYRTATITTHIIRMTSQRWMTDTFSSQSLWWHHLAIVIPDQLNFPDAAILTIEMGDQTDDLPTPENNDLLFYSGEYAAAVGVVAVLLRQNPNQPITFPADDRQLSRFEDEIIAWTWRKYMLDGGRNGTARTSSILQFPMTKAAKAALDTVQDFCYTNNQLNITRFMVTGASKRGWATYLIAALDDRVVAMAPQVFTVLNFRANIKHHYRSLGGYSWAFGDYWRENLTSEVDSPLTDEIMALIDPYAYRSRYNGMPKLIINAAGDEFFLNDDSHYFWNDLPEPKYYWMIENTNHALIGAIEEVYENLQAFYKIVLNGWNFPEFTWTRETTTDGARITVTARSLTPTLTSWEADTSDDIRRDFRLLRLPINGGDTPEANDVLWIEDAGNVDDLGGGRWSADVDYSELTGNLWRAFFIQATFTIDDGDDLSLSTECHHIPDVFPFPPCSGAQCYGKLV